VVSGRSALEVDNQTMSLLTCPVCSTEVDPSGPAVLRFDHARKPPSYMWQPFVEDLRTSAATLLHARCYTDEHGLEALLGLITASDRRQREYAYRMWARISGLREAPER
jgi:hypothetical protein